MGLIIAVGDTNPTFPYDYYYGIEWDTTVSNPVPTRIGKMELHRTLPVQSRMRRCLLKDNGEVNYYLHPNDSTKRDNGAAADLTGTDGQLMVELPGCYVRFEQEGTKCRALMSDRPLPGFRLWRKDYVSADEACLQRSTNILCAVVNSGADYRGGDNNAAYDNTDHTFLGRPANKLSLTDARTYARRRGSTQWNCYLYQTHRKLWWLFAIEYCNFNSQAPFNAALTPEGYHQGGLGPGVTTFGDYAKISAFNGVQPFVPCGYTNTLGNRTGVVDYTMPASYGEDKVVSVPSYRGVANPFGHTFKLMDGCLADIQTDGDGGGESHVYVCDEPSLFASEICEGYQLRAAMPIQYGYIKAIALGEHGDIIPSEVGASSSTYFCDVHDTPTQFHHSSTAFTVGGTLHTGDGAGLLSSYFHNTANYNSTGTRLCFYPQNAHL